MEIVSAKPNEYLVVGRDGKLTNQGTAVTTFLWPGSIYVLVPSTKQEATFELTQESKDGVPLRFKGVVVYRIIDPAAAARQFDFTGKRGLTEINLLIQHIVMGELRAVIAQMTMVDCIEQRKTTLTTAVESELRAVVQGNGAGAGTPGATWGVEIEVVQVAQVFIQDSELRRQLEAEVRNEIKARSDESDIRTQEGIRAAQIESERRLQEKNLEAEKDTLRTQEEIKSAQIESERRLQEKKLEAEKDTLRTQEEIKSTQIESERRLQEKKLEADKDNLRSQEEIKSTQIESERRLQEKKLEADKDNLRAEEELESAQIESERRLKERKLEAEKDNLRQKEELETAQIASQRRLQKEAQETAKADILLEQERQRVEQIAAEEKAKTAYPVQLLEIQNRRALLEIEVEVQRLASQIKELESQAELLIEKERLAMRKEILPLEQTPKIAEAVSKVFHGANLSIYGGDNALLPMLTPVFDLLSKVLKNGGADD